MAKVLLVLLLSLAACTEEKTPEPKPPRDAVEAYKIKLLFEHDHCKIYRFLDADQYIYWTTCSGSTRWTKITRASKTTKIHRKGVTGGDPLSDPGVR